MKKPTCILCRSRGCLAVTVPFLLTSFLKSIKETPSYNNGNYTNSSSRVDAREATFAAETSTVTTVGSKLRSSLTVRDSA